VHGSGTFPETLFSPCDLEDSIFLWFCTGEGLSRFDGYSFTNYTVAQGLPEQNINDLLESREGVYWVATGAGLCRFDPRPFRAGKRQRFEVYSLPGDRANWINVVAEDDTGEIWTGTNEGLFRLRRWQTSSAVPRRDRCIPATCGRRISVLTVMYCSWGRRMNITVLRVKPLALSGDTQAHNSLCEVHHRPNLSYQ
jgi:streptogramin lyase